MVHSYKMFCPVAYTYHFLFSGLSNLKIWATLTKPTWHSQLGILEVRKTLCAMCFSKWGKDENR